MSAEMSTTLVLACIYGIIAISVQLGLMSGAFSFAPVGWTAMGAYLTSVASTEWEKSPEIGLLAAMAIALVAGPIVTLPIRRVSGLYFALVSLAFVMVAQSFFANADYFGGALGIFGMPLDTTLAKAIVFVAVIGAVATWVSTGSRGRAVRAAGDDPLVARSLGVNVNAIHLMIGALSAVIATTAGYLYVGYVGYIDPNKFGFHFVVDIAVMVIIGGRRNWVGALLGALLILALPQILRPLEEWREIVNGALLILVVILYPNGLLQLVKDAWALVLRAVAPRSAPPNVDDIETPDIEERLEHGAAAGGGVR
jgi:branched-chain amino acid transport system permease protein